MLKKSTWAAIAMVLYCLTTSAQVADTIRVEFNSNTQLQYIFNNPNDFKIFEETNLDSLTRVLSQQVSGLSAKLDTTLILNNDSNSYEPTTVRDDFLEITPILGASLIRTSLVPDYGVRLSVNLGYIVKDPLDLTTSKTRHSFFAEYQHFAFFESGQDKKYQQFGNGFLNLGYGQSRGDESLNINLGYLVTSNGGQFGANTMKFELHMPVKGHLSISPFIIATDNFSSIIPGVRLSVL